MMSLCWTSFFSIQESAFGSVSAAGREALFLIIPVCLQPLKLHFVVVGVEAVFFHQLPVGSPLRDPLIVDYTDFVRIADGGKAVGDGDGGSVFGKFFQADLNVALALIVQGGGGLVRIRMGGFFKNTRAMEILCFCPPESLVPRSPTKVSYPSGRLMMKSWMLAFFAASMISSMDAPGLP